MQHSIFKRRLTRMIIPMGMLIIFLAGDINSQGYYGVKIGTGIFSTRPETNPVIGEDQSVLYDLTFRDSRAPLSAGAFMIYHFGWLYLQSDLMYTVYDSEFKITSHIPTDEPGLETNTYIEKNQYLDLSVMAGLRVQNFRYGVGPIFHLIGQIDSDLERFDFYEKKTRWLTYGFQGGVGYDMKRFHFDLKYETIFRTVGYHIVGTGGPTGKFRSKSQLMTFAVGFSF